ncbi:hypothetical protein [Kineococcus arenarius]|uniref:hypothetical protein n=1 Tax=Kineococcus sp. SYSU DK007 TaxID=3383128 RepID=UPI003D7D86D5
MNPTTPQHPNEEANMSTYDVAGGPGATAADAGSTGGAKERAQQTAGSAKEQAGQVTGTAKEQAGAVAGTAKEQAGAVAGTAKEEAGHVVHSAQEQLGGVLQEAQSQAVDLLGELRRQVDEQSTGQRDKLAAFLKQAGTELSQMSSASEGSGMATQLVRQAGDRAGALGDALSSREPRELLEQVRSYARRRPGAFLLGALAAGALAGRVTRGAQAAHSSSGSEGRELEPLGTAPTPGATGTLDLPGSDLSSTYAAGVTGTGTTTAAGTSANEAVARYGEDPNEDLVPHHIASDVPSVSDAPSHGSRP